MTSADKATVSRAMASSQTPVEMSQMDTARPELERFTTADAVLKDPTASDEAQAKETVATKEDAPALTTDGAADATPAIGPAVDDDEAVDKVAAVASAASPPDDSADVPGSAVMVVLLLTTGARHPFRIDHRYLEKRSVTPAEGEPLNISVYTVKELIWRDWRDEWEPRPSSPSYIRLITFGRLLEDKNTLKGLYLFYCRRFCVG